MKLVHAADLHLDSPLRGLERYEGAPVRQLRDATRQAFTNLVDMCLAERADVLVLAGDLYDGDWRDYNTGLFFVAATSRLRAGGVRVFMVRGNHDAQSQLTRSLRLPEGVHDFSCDAAETVVLDSLGLAVHGRGYAQRATVEDLASSYPLPVPGAFNVGVLHTCADGREGHEPYAPCRTSDLVDKGYDYWALGHVHTREVLSAEPWVVFPGNLQGRHAREVGPKGATVVTIESGRVRAVEHRALDVVRWEQRVVDVADARSAHDVVDLVTASLSEAQRAADGRMLAARVILQGHTPAYAQLASDSERWTHEIRAAVSDAGAGEIWVEKIVSRIRAPLGDTFALRRDDAVGGLARAVREMRDDDQALAYLYQELGELRRKLPPEYREGVGALRLDHPSELRDVLEDVEQLLVARLLAAEAIRLQNTKAGDGRQQGQPFTEHQRPPCRIARAERDTFANAVTLFDRFCRADKPKKREVLGRHGMVTITRDEASRL